MVEDVEHQGYIFIADITGYTVFLNESELDHARGTLSSLLELLIEHTKPPLVISGLEGDAVFSYGLEDRFVDPQTLLETIEETYVSFRRAIELMVLNNTCQCSACANVSSLDLKFFLHYGTFALQKVGESRELMGRDVNLIHRLLKNSVTKKTGIRAYMLCTEAAIDRLAIDGSAERAVSYVEEVPDFGEVRVWVKDMHPIYEARQETATIEFDPSEILGRRQVEISLPVELVWDYLTHSEFRNLLSSSDRYAVIDRKGGRIGEGSVYQCYHGDQLIPQIVVEWRPFERIVIKQTSPVPGPPNYVHIALNLSPTETGTVLEMMGARPTGAFWQRPFGRAVYKLMDSSLMAQLKEELSFKRGLERFRDAIEDDAEKSGLVDVKGRMKPSADLVSEAARNAVSSD